MSAAHRHDPVVPKAMLQLAGILVGGTILAVAAFRIAGLPPAASPVIERQLSNTAAIASRDLRFIDRDDGSVRIIDVSDGSTAGVVAAGSTSGFIRGAMRGLARDRRARGIGDGPPFRLTAWENGQLSLTDSATGRTIELSSFGATNRAAFAALLK